MAMKVSAHGNPRQLAGAIAHYIRAKKDCVLLPISANAVQHAVLATAITTEFLRKRVADGFQERPVWFRTLEPTTVFIDGHPHACTRIEVLAVDSGHLELVGTKDVEEIQAANFPGVEALVGLIQSQLGNSKVIDIVCRGPAVVHDAVRAIHLAPSSQEQLRIFPTFEEIGTIEEPKAKVVLRVCAIE